MKGNTAERRETVGAVSQYLGGENMSKWGEGIIIALLAAIFYLLLPASEKQTFDNISSGSWLHRNRCGCALWLLAGGIRRTQQVKEPAKPMRTPAEQAEYDRNMATALALNRRKWK